jgi:hypothetical protein
VTSHRHVPLARTIFPEPGEWLPSYLDRLAAFAEVPLTTMLARVGLIDKDSSKALNNGYGIFLHDERVRVVAKLARLDEAVVRGMLLSHYDGNCLRLNLDDGVLREGQNIPLHQWAFFSGSLICPKCLTDSDGVWQLAWKLPWSFLCVKHKLLLVNGCPRCDLLPAQWRSDRVTKPRYPSLIPRPGFCFNSMHKHRDIVSMKNPCGQNLRLIKTASVENFPQLISTQLAIHSVLTTQQGTVAGQSVTSLEFFDSLRSLSQLIAYAAYPNDLATQWEIPKRTAAEFKIYVEQRERTYTERDEAKRLGLLPAKGPRHKQGAHAPNNPALMAGLLTEALWILNAPDLDEFSERFDWLVNRARAKIPKLKEMLYYFSFPPTLANSYSIYARNPHFNFTVGIHSKFNSIDDHKFYNFEPRHVPQVMWKENYEELFAPLFIGWSEMYARRVCSAALVKICGDYTWAEAGKLLGLPEQRTKGLGNWLMTMLTQNNQKEIFAEKLHQVASRLEGDKRKTDYALRREYFGAFDLIPREDWQSILKAAGAKYAKARTYASVWVWAEATGSDWRLAPRMQRGNVSNLRSAYTRFLRKTISGLEPELKNYIKQQTAKMEPESASD